MIDRRGFLHAALGTAAATAGAPRARVAAAGSPQERVLGANDRIRVGLIGCGRRGNQVANDWLRHDDTEIVATCDVFKSNLDETTARLAEVQGGASLDTYEDYRRILDRQDIDAVIVATPDHWHAPQTIDACEAGKDIFVEKPLSNGIEPMVKMVEAARAHSRVVQVGLQQRSWHHFQEAAALTRDGYYGESINHVVMSPPGRARAAQPEQPTDPPPGLNWELFQGPAERKPYVPSRQRGWRGYYDYGAGNLADWGVHLTDVMFWYLQADEKAPLLTSASAQYALSPHDPERVPETYAVTWQFDNFVATLSNTAVPTDEDAMSRYGNYFYGDRGVLLVNRMGYEVSPWPAPGGGPPGAPEPPPPIEAKQFRDPGGMSEDPDSTFGSATGRHVRNFLDCVRSREKPACDIEVGFNSTLPCLLAIVAVREGETVRWDGKAART